MSLIPNIQKKQKAPKQEKPSVLETIGMIAIPIAIGAATGGLGGAALYGLEMTAAGTTLGGATLAGATLGSISGAGAGTTTAISAHMQQPIAYGGGTDPIGLLYSPTKQTGTDSQQVESVFSHFGLNQKVYGSRPGGFQPGTYNIGSGGGWDMSMNMPNTYQLDVPSLTPPSFASFGYAPSF
jgi:hypothetical protein